MARRRTLLLRGGGILVLWLALTLGLLFALRHTSLLRNFFRSAQFQTIVGPNGSTSSRLKPQFVPRDFATRVSSPSAYLLPSQWLSEPAPLYRVGSSPLRTGAKVDPATAAAVAAVAGSFLAAWESYTPFDDASFARYRQRIASLADPAALVSLSERQESHQPPLVCAEPVCTVGSAWLPIPADNAQIVVRAADTTHAYVTRYGVIRYQAPGQGLDGRKVVREYGLLLGRRGGRWVVSRAVADTAADF